MSFKATLYLLKSAFSGWVNFLLFVFTLTAYSQAPELKVQLGHSKIVYSVAFSPDGKYVASGSADFTFKLWEVESGKEVRTFKGHSGYVTAVCFSPDGKYLLSGGGSYDIGELKLWEISTGKLVREFPGHKEYVWDACFNKDGSKIISGSFDNTIKIWETGTGKLLKTLEGAKESIYALALTPDEKHIISGGGYFESELFIWDIEKGKIEKTMKQFDDRIEALDVSPDGMSIVTADAKGIKLWDVTTGEMTGEYSGHEDWVSAVVYTKDGQYIYSGSFDNTIKKWDVAAGKEITTLHGHKDRVYALAISPDGKLLVSGGSFDKSLKIWDVATGEAIKTLAGYNLPVSGLEFSNDGRYLFCSGNDESSASIKLERWDFETGERITYFSGNYQPLKDMDLSPDGNYLLAAGPAHWITEVEHQSKDKSWSLEGHTGTVNTARYSSDGKFIVSTSGDYDSNGELKLWDAATSKVIHEFSDGKDKQYGALFTSDGKSIIALTSGSEENYGEVKIEKWNVANYKKEYSIVAENISNLEISPNNEDIILTAERKIQLRDLVTGKIKRQFGELAFEPISIAVSADGNFLATGGGDWGNTELKVWDIQSGKLLKEFHGHLSEVTVVVFSPDGKFLVSGSSDTQIKIWDWKTGKEIASLNSMDGDNSDYVVVTPDGLFDGTQTGIKALLHYVVGTELIELDQLKERYYEPGILQKLFGYNDEPLRDVTAFSSVKLYPRVDLEVTEQQRLKMKLTEREGGIGRIQMFVNNTEIIYDARSLASAQENELTVSLSDFSKYFLPNADNAISVKVFNEEGYLSSNLHSINYFYKLGKQSLGISKTPKLYAVVIGTSNYRGTTLDLKFADKDAEDMATSVSSAGAMLLGNENVQVELLNTAATSETSLPTKENIKNTFSEFAKTAQPNDILMVFLSGHGVNYGDAEGSFYYLTSGVESGDLKDDAIRTQYAISTNELTDWMNQVPVGKRVLILDACSSGKLVEDLLAMKAVSSSQIRAIERLNERTGTFIIAGSAADMVSFEASQFGQSLLTYSLLLGMSGAALRESEYVDVMMLFQYAADKVPEFAQYVGGIQKPVIFAPDQLASFDIGHVTSEVKIPLGKIKPLFLRSSFLDQESLDDALGLSDLVDERFRNISAKGKEAPLIFVDTKQLPNARYVNGLYTISGDQVTLRAKLYEFDENKEKKSLGEFELTGLKANIQQMLDDILARIEALME